MNNRIRKAGWRGLVWLALAIGVSSPLVAAQESAEALGILQRMLKATHDLSYVGVLVYQQGAVSETARLARLFERGSARERMEILDGAPRELFLANDQIECYLPQFHRVTVEQVLPGRSLLPILPASADVAAWYRVRKDGTARIAGRESDTILLEPRDGFRYAQRYWVDRATGMLLKAQTIDDQQAILEQFVFTQMQIGGVLAPSLLRQGYALSRLGSDWRIDRAGIRVNALDDGNWRLSAIPPGYRKTMEVLRGMSHNARVGQIVVSDGVAAVSVFIEPARADVTTDPTGVFRSGAFHVFKRRVDDFVVTAVGEAPALSIQTIAEGVILRR